MYHTSLSMCLGRRSNIWRDDNSTIMGKWKWLFVNGCECESVMSTVWSYFEEYYYFNGINK
jgi:hypothetical protein